MNIQIQKLREDAVLPNYAHPGDAGMDLYAVEAVTLAPGSRVLVPTGIALALPDGHVGLVWDKSGRAVKDGITTMAGVIDAGYRGEIQVLVLNVSESKVVIAAGEKVAQMLVQPVVSPTLAEVALLDETARGDGGFGSTGLS